MKNLYKTVILFLLLAPLSSFSQTDNVCLCGDGCVAKAKVPVVTKGYYSIGNNAKKLAKCPACCRASQTDDALNTPAVSKGYYAIGENNKKIKRSTNQGFAKAKEPVKKGYYSIGSNSEKLQDRQQAVQAKQCSCN